MSAIPLASWLLGADMGSAPLISRRGGVGLAFPSQGGGDLARQKDRVKWLDENCGYSESGKLLPVPGLNFCSQENHRDRFRGWPLAKFQHRGRPIHLWHHDVEQNGVGMLGFGFRNSLSAA